MVYKRFIKRGEKVYGPYNYQSKKVDGKVVSEYVGKPTLQHHRRGILAVFIFTLLLVSAFLFLHFSPTGNVSLNLNENYKPGETINGILKFSLSQNEFIPADSLVTLTLNNQSHSVKLSDLISGSTNGNFQADGTSISGAGEGFGLGAKKVYPTINFEYKIAGSLVPGAGSTTSNNSQNSPIETTNDSSSSSSSSSTETQAPSTTETTTTSDTTLTDNSQTPSTTTDTSTTDVTSPSTSDTTSTETSSTTSSDSNSQSTSDSASSTSTGSGMTGNVIAEDETKTGTVSYDNPFTYDLADGETIEIISATIYGKDISTSELKLTTDNNQATITTDYFTEENVSKNLQIDLSKFNIKAEEGNLQVSLDYNNETIATTSEAIKVAVVPNQNISLNETQIIPEQNLTTNETIILPSCNETIIDNCTNLTIINETIILPICNETLTTNCTLLNITIPNCNETDIINCTTVCMNLTEITNCSLFFNSTLQNVSMNITTLVSNIRVGVPVKWKKIVRLNQSDDNVSISIPSIADNISVDKIDEKNKQNITLDENSFSVTGNVVAQVDLNKKSEGILTRLWNSIFSMTGNVVEDNMSVVSNEPQTSDSQLVTVTDNVTQVEINYETPAPTANETAIVGGKQILISGPDEIHYQNITAFSYIPETPLANISLFWVDQNMSVQFDGYDTNDDGNVDYIEWLVPHLSNQTYRVFGLLPNGGSIDFVDPTPANGTNLFVSYAPINVSISDSNLNNLSYNWNGINYVLYDGNLVAMYNFNNGNLNDSSIYGNNLTISGSGVTSTSSGKYGYAYNFDGNGYLQTPTPSTKTTDVTMSAWARPTNNGVSQSIIYNGEAGGAGYGIMIISGKYNILRGGVAWDVTTISPDYNQWQFVTLLMNASGEYFCKNTVCVYLSDGSNNGVSGNFYVGSIQNGYPNFYGDIDEVTFYNRSLSQSELDNLYISNLGKINSTDFIFQKTQSNLVTGSYTYSATACDASSVCNSTETRNLQVILPKVNLTVDSSLVSGLSVESNSLFYVLFNLSCTNTNCGNISVYLDPIGSTCVAETSTCDSTCGSVFKATPSSFSYSSNGLCGQYMGLPDFTGCTATDANGVYTTAIDSVCDYYLGPGTGDCARFGDYNMYADYVCPSYQRKGSAVTEADCVIPSEFCGPANLALTDIFDFSSPFFATGDVVKGLVNTTIGATPFWTATNPMNISLNNGESYLVNFTVNASGQDSVKPYKFYAWANVSSTPSISSVSLKFNVTIIPSFNPINIIYPQAIAYNSDVTTFDYSYTGSGDRCWYTTNSGVTNSSTVTAGTNFTSVSVNLGYNTWIIYCNTSSNTIYSKNVTFLRDIIPQVSFISPTPVNNNISLSKPTINVSIFDYNLKNVTLNWNGISSSTYDDNLVLMYNFDDYTRLNDSSSRNNSGFTHGNSAYTTSGKYGGAYTFDGDGDYISTTNYSDFNFGSGNFAVEAWFYPTEVSSQRTIFASTSDFWLGSFIQGGTMRYFASSNGGSWDILIGDSVGQNGVGVNSISVNQWHHMVFMRSGNQWLGYIDGNLDLNVTSASSLVSKNEVRNIGRWGNAGYWFVGSIDEFKVYNRSLSYNEVQNEYNSNLFRLNSTQWYFSSYKNDISYGLQNYSLSACDVFQNCNVTDTRNLSYIQCGVASDCSAGFSCVNNLCVDNTNPLISFISPTPANNNITNSPFATINVSITEPNLKNLTLNFDSSKLLFEEPPIRSGLVLWTSADRGVTKDSSNKTSVWADQSGNGNSFVQSSPSQQPTWIQNSVNGRPALRMVASSSQTMYSSTNYPAPTTVIYAAKTNGGTVGRVLAGKANNWILGWYSGGKNEAYFEGWVNNPNTAPTTTSVIYSATIGGSGVNSNFYGNGNLLASNQGGVTGPNGLCLSGYQCSSEFSDADVFEVLVYNRILNSTEIADVNGYLAVKYGLSSSLPSDNSYYNITMPKINSTDYILTVQKSNLDFGNHTYYSNVSDFASNTNSTDFRTMIVSLPFNSNPSIDMFYPYNNLTIGRNSISFYCNGTGSPYLDNLTLYIWDSSSNVAYSNTKILGGVFNSSSWNYSFSNKDQYKWNCLGGGSNGNFSWSNQGNYTLNAGYNSLKTIYSYTGADQIYTVPAGVYSIETKMWGAGGGGGYAGGWSYGYAGGAGGYSNQIMKVTPGENITIVVGQGGNKGSTSSTSSTYGGGARSCSGSDCRYGGAGGGRSALRVSNITDDITAGAGGGGGASRSNTLSQAGGAGGGLNGQDGYSDEIPTASGKGGSQTSGGAGGTSTGTSGQAGSQFMGGYSGTNSYGGGGGGGYYGGGGGAYQESNTMGGAGGGSGYTLFGGTTITGVNNTAANSADSDRLTAGNGGNENTDGANGKVIIITYGDFPEINLSLVSPVIPKNVSTGSLFNMIFNLTCSGANCGLINVFLDPQPTGSLTNGLIPIEFGSAIDGTGAIYGCQGFTSGADKATDGDITTGYAWWDGFSYTDSGVVFSLPSNYSIAQINTIYRTSDSPCNCWCSSMPSVIRIEVYDYATSNWITPAGMSNINSGSENTWYNETATTPVSSDKVRVVAQDNGASLMEIEVYGSTGGGPKGLVNISVGAIPFYTPTNPINVSLNSGQSQLVTFSVTANGANSSTPYAFFGFANVSATPTVGSISNQVNVTIVYQINPLTIVYPSATTYLYNVNSLNYTLDVAGDKCWYSIDSGVTNSSSIVAGTNFTGIASVPGTNLWTVYCNDSNSTLYSNSVIFTRDIPPQISYVSPTPANGVNTTNTSPIINFSIISSNLKNVTFNWNGANTSYKISSDVTMATNYNDPTLMLALDFDNDTNALVDLSTSGNNGTAGGNAVYTSSGKYNGGFTFDGSGDYITRTNPILPSLNSNRTIALWEKTSATGRQILFGIGNSGAYAEVTLYPDIGTGFFLDTSAGYLGTGGATPDDGNWHHLAVTYNGSVWKTYLDGVPKNNLTLVSNLNNNVYSVGVDSNNLATYPFNGQIDEVRVYNRSLSDAEIQEIYNSSLKKLNSTDWNLQVNKNNLVAANYIYSATASNVNSNTNSTETRTLTIAGCFVDGDCMTGLSCINYLCVDNKSPFVNFISPTFANSFVTTNTSAIVNVSVTEPNLKNVTLNWNGGNSSYIISNQNDTIRLLNYADTNLKLALQFDNSSDLIDKSGHYTITDSNSVWNSSGYIGGGRDLSTNKYLNTNFPTAAFWPISISYWMYPRDVNTTSAVIGSADLVNYLHSYGLGSYISGGKVYGKSSNNNAGWMPLNYSISNNTWYHVVITFDKEGAGATGQMYVNGQKVAQTVNTAETYGYGFAIGASLGNGYSSNFNGVLDEILIYNKVLSAGEIQSLYNSRLQRLNSTDWNLAAIESNLTAGNYNYSLTAYDSNNATNFTSRTLTVANCLLSSDCSIGFSCVNNLCVDNTNPLISFISPTPANLFNTTNVNATINVSVTEPNLKNVSFINGANSSIYDDSLVLMMNFDNRSSLGENGTYVVDVSKYGNNATAFNGVKINGTGKYDGGANFDGTSNYFDLGATPKISATGNWTISSWINTRNPNKEQTIFGQYIAVAGNGRLLFYISNSQLDLFLGNDATQSSVSLYAGVPSSNNWYYVTSTRSGNTFNIYVNGVLINTTTDSGTRSILQTGNLIGERTDSATGYKDAALSASYFNGTIDEFRIYNRTLSATEIQSLYNSNLAKINSTDWLLQVNKNNLSFGTYTYSSSACDTSNNCNSTETRSLIVDAGDLNAPLVNLLSPLNNSISNTTNFVNFIFNVSDVSNISSCTLSALVPGVVLATGGNITTAGNYIVHTFTTNGTFSIPSGALNVEVLVVAGGGSGGGSAGTSIAGGGGGAGGLIYNTSYTVSGNISVVVGKGGIGQTGFTAGQNGGNSLFGSLTAVGGGYGGTWSVAATIGGSGGGAGENGQGLDGAAGIVGQGYAGGNDNGYDNGAASAGGGGGGSGTVGSDAVTNTLGGNGGAGLNYTINGSNIYYAGGGGAAGSTSAGIGGNASGGSGRAVTTGTGIAGVNGTGGGGGGSLTNGNEASQPGGNGGSGIVIVRYLSGSATNSSSSITNNANNSLSLNLSNGNYTWSVSCIDNSSNHNVGISNETRSLIVQNFGDIYAPVINLLSPINNTIQTVSSFVNFIFNVSDASNISYCNLTASSGAIVSTTGGDSVVNSGNYTIHTFSSNGTFSIPSGALNVEVMVVGGGASGGARVGGGGGAGGVILANQSLVSGIYSIVVGNGGASVSSSSGGARGNDGYNSSFNNLLALGGGGGGEYSTLWNGRNGGSGGGGDGYQSGLGGTGLQGYNGGAGSGGSGSGGGGGAGGIGATASGDTGGNGGAGVLSSINGSSVYYAGGGGGTGNSVAGSGGSGIGGNGMAGSNTPAGDGLANTGSGGGGVRDISDSGNKISGAGGSGVVIIRYLTSSVGGGINSSMNITNNANNSLSLSLSNGNYTWSVACTDNSTNHNIGSSANYSINVNVAPVLPGVLNVSFIYPRQNITVDQNGWFNVSFNVSCSQADCGNVSLSLDPEQLKELYSTGSVIVDLNKKEVQENIFVRFLNYIKLNIFGGMFKEQ